MAACCLFLAVGILVGLFWMAESLGIGMSLVMVLTLVCMFFGAIWNWGW